MKRIQYFAVIVFLILSVTVDAMADINEEMSFTNYAHEPLYIELAVLDHSGWLYYDLYVEYDACSYANFWVDTQFASYSACAYGEFTDDFYGCIEGDINDGYMDISLDNSGYPYLSGPPWQTCDVYAFESPYDTAEVYVVEEDDSAYVSAGAGCFLGTLVNE